MKKIIFISAILLICSVAFNPAVNAQSTTCTINLSGPTGHGWSYQVSFYVQDLVYAPGSQGWSNPISINVGTTNNVTIPYGVIPDCKDRWKIHAKVDRLYNSVIYDNITVSTGILDSDEYYTGPHSFTFSF